jgi:hypothetical protein
MIYAFCFIIIQLIFAVDTGSVLFAGETECLNTIKMSFDFEELRRSTFVTVHDEVRPAAQTQKLNAGKIIFITDFRLSHNNISTCLFCTDWPVFTFLSGPSAALLRKTSLKRTFSRFYAVLR